MVRIYTQNFGQRGKMEVTINCSPTVAEWLRQTSAKELQKIAQEQSETPFLTKGDKSRYRKITPQRIVPGELSATDIVLEHRKQDAATI